MKSLPNSVSVLCLSLLALAACSKNKPAAPPAPKVAVTTAHVQTVPLTRQFVGRLSPYYSANVTARVSGVLVKRIYAEGSAVRQGQVLFEIDPAFYKAQLDNDIAQLAQDQAIYVNDHITAVRNRKLLPVGSVSQQTVDNSDAAERSAAAKVQADQALVESARINLGYTRVTAPISGIAGQQLVTAGALVGSGTSDTGASSTLLTTVQQVDPVYVNFTISAADLITLRQSQGNGVDLAQQSSMTVQVSLPNGTPYDHTGTLDFSDPAVNATTGTVNLRALVANPQHLLLPGMYVTLIAHLGQQSNVVLIPQQALLRDTEGPYVLAVGPDNKVARKDVETNASLGTDWIVTKGLAEGDRVVVTGVQSVHEGSEVSATPWQPAVQPLAAASGSQPASAAQ
ncbi:efflux RND transporter periplasmic adaptor subunit [Trinickia violacea]|uniref:Efflux RND transporter periplasmic adaptor subunit n=1 Tax=Trinickia violacea TaxID=2571746 RepID=A0A4P8IUJ8_9BURK|nr:efflux RND transporter periplasmic adaptor subunit [Trinickia violacea]QCP52066.1 efflux RND transporter periplasmic adaptor subunit [Trinickia violacea]